MKPLNVLISHECPIRWKRSNALLVAALLCACLFALPAVSSATPTVAGALKLQAPDSVQIDCFEIVPLNVSTDPDVIETGIPCGMASMCDQDQCLCGSPDEYGACACNGTKQTSPDIQAVSDNEAVARTVWLFGSPYLVSLSSGNCAVQVTGSLVHYGTASASVEVAVAPMTPLDVLRLVAALAAIAAVVAGLVMLVRRIVRALSRKRKMRKNG